MIRRRGRGGGEFERRMVLGNGVEVVKIFFIFDREQEKCFFFFFLFTIHVLVSTHSK